MMNKVETIIFIAPPNISLTSVILY